MIYYVYRRSDGMFMGSGITLFDDDTYGSTNVQSPTMEDGQMAKWDGCSWVIQQPTEG